MWMHLYRHDDDGRIIDKLSADSRDMLAIGLTHELLSEEDVEMDTHYIKNGELRPYPEVPPYYKFNFNTEQMELDIDEARLFYWGLVKGKRRQAEFGQLEFQGNTYDIDETSQRRIQGAVQLANMDSNLSIAWTTADNTVVTLTATEVLALAVALAQRVGAAHAQGRVLRQQIYAAQTEAELQSIQWVPL